MGKTIAVVSGKGGTGKTCFTANVGTALSQLGKRVLCLDCDIVLRNLDLALGVSDRTIMDFSDVALGRCSLESAAVQHPKYRNLYVMAAPITSRNLELSDTQIRHLAENIREHFDYCLIDAPAGLGIGFQWALAMADSVVVVTTTDHSALRDAQRTVQALQRFPGGSLHLVVNRVHKKMLRVLHTNIDDAIDMAGLPLLGVIPEDSDIPLALNRGIPLREINFYAEIAYENIAKRLTGIHTPLMKI